MAAELKLTGWKFFPTHKDSIGRQFSAPKGQKFKITDVCLKGWKLQFSQTNAHWHSSWRKQTLLMSVFPHSEVFGELWSAG